jgi:hypothetical protein
MHLSSRTALAALALTALLSGQASAQTSGTSAPPAAQPSPTGPQTPIAMSESDIKAFAALHVAISKVQDSVDVQLAAAKYKTAEHQHTLREARRTAVAGIIKKSGLSEEEFQRRRFLVSTDSATRKSFDAVVAGLTGAPLPGQVAAAPAAVTIAVPQGPAGVHIGHVVNAFGDVPGGIGLLPIALAEARTAAQHATLAARAPDNLAGMKLHAGHVLHALDPSIVTMGPGKGYGVRRAATGVAAHIELAAKAEGASAGVTAHAPHIATAARSTITRLDQIVALAKQIQAATAAPEAAGLVTQMASLCEQLVTGADANSDGRVTWQAGEGGLQQAQEHVNLMLAAEKKP